MPFVENALFRGQEAYARINKETDLPFDAFGDDVTKKYKAEVDVSKDHEGGADVEHWTRVGFTATFEVNKDGVKTVKEGDYIIIDWPDAGNGNAAIALR